MSRLPRFRFNAPTGADFEAAIIWSGEDFRPGELDMTVSAPRDGSVVLSASTGDGRIETRINGDGFTLRIPQAAADAVPLGMQRVSGRYTVAGVVRALFEGGWSRLPAGLAPHPDPIVFDGVRALIEAEDALGRIHIASAPPGPPGKDGEPGAPGETPDLSQVGADFPDLTLIFENTLV